MKPKSDKEDKIRSALKASNFGLWVREVARRTGLDKSTCSRCLEGMGAEIEFEWLGRNKVYRLRGN
ncbi:MAG TPA: helix-turn-helix domain-containing protein [archaeon]|nr:helix-turn-helix domain-containing protein [archaeon]